MCKPYTNCPSSLRLMTHAQITSLILTSSFALGYFYCLLSQDEHARRVAYSKSSNFMQVFDRVSSVYEKYYGLVKQRVLSFDSSYEWWRLRQLKLLEWREKKQREEEIYAKYAEEDDVSKMLSTLDLVGQGEAIEEKKSRLKLKM